MSLSEKRLQEDSTAFIFQILLLRVTDARCIIMHIPSSAFPFVSGWEKKKLLDKIISKERWRPPQTERITHAHCIITCNAAGDIGFEKPVILALIMYTEAESNVIRALQIKSVLRFYA